MRHETADFVDPAKCLLGGGEMGTLMRSLDWSQTPVGPVDSWPQSLKTAVSVVLESKFPMYIAWGEQYTQFYNDGYRPILGTTKHPQALGGSTRDTFAESWDIIGPMFADVRRGIPCGAEDWLLPLERHGYLEDCYFTFSYSPIRDESGQVGGILVTVVETTARVLGERRLQTLLQSITDGFIALNSAWEFTYINAAGEQLLGANGNELIGKMFWDIFAPAAGTIIEQNYRRAMDDRLPTEFELLYEPWQRWFSVKAYPIENGGISIYFRETTAQKAAELALRESENRFRAMADNIPNLAWMAHRDGSIFWYNQRWFEYTGRTPEEMEGWGWQSVHHPDVLPKVLERWNSALSSGSPFEMEFLLLGADRSYRWFLTLVNPVRNESGEITRWFGTNTNIDEQKHAGEILKASEELARGVIESSPDGIEVLDLEGNSMPLNDKARALRRQLGTNPGLVTWNHLWRERDQANALDAFATAVSGSATQFSASIKQASGTAMLIDVSLAPLIGSAGNVDRVLCITRDVTLARKAEEELRQTAKLESLGVMAGGIAHDFNNLLTGILGNASLLSESVGQEDRPVAEDIVLAAERAADLTQQMLAFAGKGRFQVSQTDLSVLVREILRLVQPSMEKNVEIKLELDPDCFVEGDPGQLQQVVMNLIINASEAMEGAPGLITIRTTTVDSDKLPLAGFGSSGAETGVFVLLEVTDTGKGMDKTTQERMFDPFFTTKFTGRGLGLAAVSGIVRGHKGFLSVASRLGKGTSFKVLFPLAHVAGAEFELSGPGETEAGKKILLVDDEEIVRKVAAQTLEKSGHQVILASNGQEAVDLFRSHHGAFDLVILDVMMPVMGGEAAFRLIREHDSAVPILICSGYNEGEVLRRFSSQSLSSFLQKPYTSGRLMEKVNEAIRQPVS